MIKIIIGFVIFCITLFCYLHIQFHLKTSDELEIYEIEPNPLEEHIVLNISINPKSKLSNNNDEAKLNGIVNVKVGRGGVGKTSFDVNGENGKDSSINKKPC